MNDKTTITPFDAVLGIGSNIGNRAANLREAIARLEFEGTVTIAAQSRLYVSPPWGVTDQEPFLNACIGLKTELSPRDLLQFCQSIELQMGRERLRHWGERNIDLDILTYRSLAIDEPDLQVPHPYLAERAFVLVPFADIAPEAWVSGNRLADLVSRIDTSEIQLFDPTA